MSVPTTAPIPFCFIEATPRTEGKLFWEFNIMRTVDFIGRNYLKIRLPKIDTTEISDSTVRNDTSVPIMSDPDHIYLGAWQRDLIPRLIQSVSFYPRSNTHKLFEYTGYDIFVHNILFGNAHKCMNDLMSGEDKFELCYDPYYCNGSALGLASYKGIDAYQSFTVGSSDENGFQKYTDQAAVSGMPDGLIDYFQVDDTMDNAEFREFYRKGVWYETPVARNYNVRHSIHSRRMVHAAKDISIPLDILPFGYSIASSLPSAALSGECGYIKVTIFSDWLDRAFYLTKVSDVPSLYPIVNHRHYSVGDTTPDGSKIGAAQTVGSGDDETTFKDPREGWVNERSLGRFGDPEFEPTDLATASGFESKIKFSQPGAILGGSTGAHLREGIVPTKVEIAPKKGDVVVGGLYSQKGYSQGIAAKGRASLSTKKNWVGARTSTSTSVDSAAVGVSSNLLEEGVNTIYKMSSIDKTLFNDITNKLQVKLMQVGYQTLPCIRELLSKLPNIYITTEWKDDDIAINRADYDINNDLYIQAIILWFIPVDNQDIESMRLYPQHLMNHEMPIIAGLKLQNEQSQGQTVFDWDMLNILNPAQMNMNPLLENMGLISFSPSLTANSFPHAYYDSNISGFLKMQFKTGEGEATGISSYMNLKTGYCKCISIGINGVASVNLNLYRLVF